MTRQEALEKLKNQVRAADWLDEDYVYCVSNIVLNRCPENTPGRV